MNKAEHKPSGIAAVLMGWMEKLRDAYLRLLEYFIYHLKTGMLVSVGMVAVFIACCMSTNMVLMPEMDQGTVSVSVSTPIGSEVDETGAIADRIAGIVTEQVPELKELYYIVQPESASINLNLVDRDERQRSSKQVADSLREALQDIAGCEITTSASI